MHPRLAISIVRCVETLDQGLGEHFSSPEGDAAVRRRCQYTQLHVVSVLSHLICAGNARGGAKMYRK